MKYLVFCISFIIFTAICNGQVGTITTFAGNGTSGYTGDGMAAGSAELTFPSGIAVDGSGNVYFADYTNNVIRKINPGGIISTIAGNGIGGYSGDGSSATDAKLFTPYGVAADSLGNIYIADTYNQRIRKVNTSGVISTFAGTGVAGFGGDGSNATDAQLNEPTGVAIDRFGNVYIADEFNNRIRKVNSSIINTIGGTGDVGYTGDGGAATLAMFNAPFGLATDRNKNLFIAEWGNNVIRRIDSNGIIHTFAGGGTGWLPDGGLATAAVLNHPMGVTADITGNIYIADYNNNRIRKVSVGGYINTIAGNGLPGFSGDGMAATAAMLSSPGGVAIDGNGNIFVSDGANNRIRKICPPPMPITGAGLVCTGGHITLGDITAGGTWASTSTGIATINSSGILLGVAPGNAVVNYSVTNSCGISKVSASVTVGPYASHLTGSTSVCVGSTTTLKDSIAGGTWATSNANTTVSGGVVTGIAPGASLITYTVTNACGTAYTTKLVHVVTPPDAGAIIGPTAICLGSSVQLTDSIGGGVWASSNSTVASLDSNDIVSGNGLGTVTIY